MPEATAADLFVELVARAEELTRQFEQHPNDAVREDVFELLQAIDAIHRGAVLRLIEIVARNGNTRLIEEASADPMISSLLQLYDVLPLPEMVRWQEALDSVRETIQSRNAEVELLAVTDQMPHMRLKGGFAADEEMSIRQSVQGAISDSFGEYQSIRWEPRELPPAPRGFVAMETIKPVKRQRWIDLVHASDVPAGQLRAVEVEQMPILICRSATGFHAFPNVCPGTALPLHLGRLTGTTLECPWHGCSYDVQTGKRTGGQGKDLSPLTLRMHEDSVQMGIWE